MNVKKIFLILIATNVALFSFISSSMEAQAAVAKAVSQVAKISAKEFSKDIAMDMSFKMAMDLKYNMPSSPNAPKPKPDFEVICMPKDKKANGDCEAPLQIKKDIKRQDLEKAVENQLDKKIVGGATATKWGKFLDFFIPFFAAGLGYTIISSVLEPDVADFFDEVAYDALVEAQLLQPLSASSPSSPNVGTGSFQRPQVIVPPEHITQSMLNGENGWSLYNLKETFNIDDLVNCESSDCVRLVPKVTSNGSHVLQVLPNGGSLTVNIPEKGIVESTDFGFVRNSGALVLYEFATTQNSVARNELLRYPLPKASTNHLASLHQTKEVDGVKVHTKPELFLHAYMNLLQYALQPLDSTQPVKFNHIYSDIPQPIAPVVPSFPNTHLEPTKPPGTQVDIIAPGAYPYQDTTTGLPVFPSMAPDGSIIYTTSNGSPVSPNNVSVGLPNISVLPNGGLSVTPVAPPGATPSPSVNMNNVQRPENPNEPIKPKPKPDGDVCNTKFKDIEINKVGSAITHAFPFSIPWDLKRYLDNSFSGIGNNKPTFELPMFGENIKIQIPDYFDSWVVILKNFMVLFFDVSILFLFYRFMKGGSD